MKRILLFLILFLMMVFPKSISAASNSFITVVNPVRISSYNPDPKSSLEAEYVEVKKRGLPASWLFTYDALDNKDLVGEALQMDSNQEMGIFLEITPNFSQKSAVVYNKTDSWHRSNSLFLSGYTQEDRKKLIDSVFAKFKEDFGFYPTSVGAWWVDSYSLSYMKQKYGVDANLSVADQNSTDGYSIWGTYWSTPYYPSRINASLPANNLKDKLSLVTLQWASRDPLNGYGDGQSSRFSTQDYQTIGFKDDYFQKLVSLYGKSNKNSFGQITVGLESDMSPESYPQTFARQMEIVKNLSGDFQVTNMKGFSSWYRSTFNGLSPTRIVETDDLLGKNIKVIWYQSPFYRIGITYDKDTKLTKVLDWRVYPANFKEPFFKDPNNQLNIFINTPSIIDTVNNPNLLWQFNKELTYESGNNDKYILSFKDGSQIILTRRGVSFSGLNIPTFITKTSLVNTSHSVSNVEIAPTKLFPYPPQGLLFRGLKPELLVRLSRINLANEKYLMVVTLLGLFVFLILFGLFKLKSQKTRLGLILVAMIGLLIVGYKESTLYFISQDETAALIYLKSLPQGRVVVEDKLCLNCTYKSEFMPAAFVNKRNYVSTLSGKQIIYDDRIFNAKTRVEGKSELERLGAKYIYLAKYDNNTESLPFSPGDYNVEKIYENGNSQIWEVK